MTSPPTSRRQALRLAGAGAAAAFLASCGGGEGTRGVGGEEGARDIGVLNSVLALENAVIAAYSDGLGLLAPAQRRTMGHILGQEREHAAALGRSVIELGGAPARPKTPGEYRAGFPRLREGRDLLVFALDLEELSVKRYEDAVARLTRPSLRQTAAAIATAEASQLAVLLGELGRPRVPEAFVTGKSR